jgi:chromosome segregation ATPase
MTAISLMKGRAEAAESEVERLKARVEKLEKVPAYFGQGKRDLIARAQVAEARIRELKAEIAFLPLLLGRGEKAALEAALSSYADEHAHCKIEYDKRIAAEARVKELEAEGDSVRKRFNAERDEVYERIAGDLSLETNVPLSPDDSWMESVDRQIGIVRDWLSLYARTWIGREDLPFINDALEAQVEAAERVIGSALYTCDCRVAYESELHDGTCGIKNAIAVYRSRYPAKEGAACRVCEGHPAFPDCPHCKVPRTEEQGR